MHISMQIPYQPIAAPAGLEGRTLALAPDTCLRATPPHYLVYSSHGRGASFRTDDWQLALWIMGFATPRTVATVLDGVAPGARANVISLLRRLCELGVLVEPGLRADADPETDHVATTQAMGALLQSTYRLADELRGLGPAAHRMLNQRDGLSLQRRIESLLTTVGSLETELSGLREEVVGRQLRDLDIDADSRALQVHIGCGGHHLEGWVNVDNHPAPLSISLAWGLPLPSGSARYVFLSHLLEHLFHPGQSDRLLQEIRRILQPDGIVRIVVPDIEQCINAYVNDDRQFFAERRRHWTWLAHDLTRLEAFLAYAGAGPDPQALFDSHKFGYDYETLCSSLKRAGFASVRRCGYQSSPHETLRVDHASSNAGFRHGEKHYSLFVEASVS